MVVVSYTPRGTLRHVFTCERPMIVDKLASRRSSGSDLARVDAHQVKPHEYRELPDSPTACRARRRQQGWSPGSGTLADSSSCACRLKLWRAGVPPGQAGKPAWQSVLQSLPCHDRRVRPNQSFKRRATGMALGPRAAVVHHAAGGPSATPLSPAQPAR